MDESKKYRWTLIGLVVMVLLNIGLIASMWIFQPPPRVTSGVSTRGFEERGLSLTEPQREQFIRLLRERNNRAQAIGSDVSFKMGAYFQIHLDGDTTLTQEELDSLAANIQRQQRELDGLMFEYNARMRQVLDEEQRSHFNEIIASDSSYLEQYGQRNKERLRRMFRNPGGRSQ